MRSGGFVLSAPERRADDSQRSNTYLLLMGQSVLLPWAKAAGRAQGGTPQRPVMMSGGGDTVSGGGDKVSPLESLDNSLEKEPSLSRGDEIQKTSLLLDKLGSDFCMIDEVAGRRSAWLELSLEQIADAISAATGFERFRTVLKHELDARAHVTAPQNARFTRRRGDEKPPSRGAKQTEAEVAAHVAAEQRREDALRLRELLENEATLTRSLKVFGEANARRTYLAAVAGMPSEDFEAMVKRNLEEARWVKRRCRRIYAASSF